MLSPQAKSEWVSLLAIGAMVTVAAGLFGWTWGLVLVPLATLALVAFYRDPARRTPSNRRVMVSPADGRVSSIHEVEHFEPLGGPALCVRVFISILNVHVVRSPCHAAVGEPTVREGRRLSALHPRAPEDNAAVLVPLDHPVKGKPVAAVRLIAGLFARSISVCAAPPAVIQRGERLGIIKLGSTAELYVPMRVSPAPAVEVGQKVRAGVTVLVEVASESDADADADDASVDGDGAGVMATAAGASAAVLPPPPMDGDALGVETPSAPVGEIVAPASAASAEPAEPAEPDDVAEDVPVQEPEADEDAPRGGDVEAGVDDAVVDETEPADDAGAADAWADASEADGESSDEEDVEEEDLEDEEFEEEDVEEEDAEDAAADDIDEESEADAEEAVDDEDEWEVVEDEEGYEDGEEAVEDEDDEDVDEEEDEELDEHEDDEAEEDWGGEVEEAADEGVEEDGLEEAAVEEAEEGEEGEEVEDDVAEDEPEDADPFAEDSQDESPVGLPTGLFGVAVDELPDDEPIDDGPVVDVDPAAGSGADQSEASADMPEGDEPHTPLAPPPKAKPKFEPKRKR